jgi:hypothetical protein
MVCGTKDYILEFFLTYIQERREQYNKYKHKKYIIYLE